MCRATSTVDSSLESTCRKNLLSLHSLRDVPAVLSLAKAPMCTQLEEASNIVLLENRYINCVCRILVYCVDQGIVTVHDDSCLMPTLY